MLKVMYAALAATALCASTASIAADVPIVINEGVQVLPVTGAAGQPIRAYDAVGERRNGGFAEVTTTAPRNGNGSLEISGDRSRYVIGNIYGTDAFGGGAAQPLFALSQLSNYTFDWRVTNPSVGGGAHNTPAVRLHIIDNGIRSEMIWEGVYNGGASGVAPGSDWTFADANSVFYLNVRSNGAQFLGANPTLGLLDTGVVTLNGGQLNKTIASWQSSGIFSSNAYVTGLSFGAGGGAGVGFLGFVDNVNVGVAGNNFALNFESAVPEPATWAMMIGGFGMIGGALRSRRRTTVSFA